MDQGIKNPALGEGVRNLSGTEFFNKLLPNLISLSFIVGAIIFVAIIIVGAIQWIISGGDKAAIESAKSKITNAVIGLVILLSLFAIIYILENFFGIKLLELRINFLE
ncbi:MAG: hypothetical protein CH104c_0689 [Candidatus Woesebacteria bacterium]|nr:MAG: hypothetical protein CH104c_0689 [Candidatus Woesebacteria bacterium]